MNEMTYNKQYHYIDSISVLLDLDTVIYIFVLALIIWGIIRLVLRIKKKQEMRFLDYLGKYFYSAYIPVFIFYSIQLIMSHQYIATNIIINFLPVVYGVVLQLIFRTICNGRKRKTIKSSGVMSSEEK